LLLLRSIANNLTVAALAPNANLVPTDAAEVAEVAQWKYFADQEIFIPLATAFKILNGRIPYNTGVFDALVNGVVARLEVVDKILLKKTYIVGERISVADVFLASALTAAFTGMIDASLRAKIPNVVRYNNTIINTPKLAPVFGKVEYVEKQPQFVAPTKEKKEKAPKAPKPDAPKKEKAPKKEVEVEDEEPLVPAEVKVKNPLDDLPKSSFNLEEWKRQYSNLDTRGAGGSLEWFEKNFDAAGFSIHRIDFKYNEELTLPFMSANQIGGLMARWEASRKYLFASVGVLGKTNDSVITGVVVLRGQDAGPVLEVAPDMDSYTTRPLDVSKPEDKAFFDGAMAWDLVEAGREWADGKNFK
jgi:elongation factor 1-gamma